MAVLAKNQYVQTFVINNKEPIRNKLNSLHCKKDNDKFLHLSRMTQDQMNRLTESVSDRDVGLFRHVPTTKSDFSDILDTYYVSRTFPTYSKP
jgi:hypothetical protein